MQIEAVRGVLEEHGNLPVNIKFLIEGEEEVGSPHLEDLLSREKQKLAADLIVVSDTTMVGSDTPSTTVSMRGLVTFDVKLRTARSDLHSGIWGGTVPNAALVAARLVASLHDAAGRRDAARLLRPRAGADRRRSRLAGRHPLRRGRVLPAGRCPLPRRRSRPYPVRAYRHSPDGRGGRPALRLRRSRDEDHRAGHGQFQSGLPARAGPACPTVAASFQALARRRASKSSRSLLRREGGVARCSPSVDHPAVRILCAAIERVWGKQPLFSRGGAAAPRKLWPGSWGRRWSSWAWPARRQLPCPQRAPRPAPAVAGRARRRRAAGRPRFVPVGAEQGRAATRPKGRAETGEPRSAGRSGRRRGRQAAARKAVKAVAPGARPMPTSG